MGNRTIEQVGEEVLAAVREITAERRAARVYPDHALRLEVRRRVHITDAQLTKVLRFLKKRHTLRVGRTINDGYIRIIK